MITQRYRIEGSVAEKANRFYENSSELPESLSLISRHDDQFPKSVNYKFTKYKGAICTLTIHTLHDSLIQFVEVSGDEDDSWNIKDVVEKALKIRLLYSLTSD